MASSVPSQLFTASARTSDPEKSRSNRCCTNCRANAAEAGQVLEYQTPSETSMRVSPPKTAPRMETG